MNELYDQVLVLQAMVGEHETVVICIHIRDAQETVRVVIFLGNRRFELTFEFLHLLVIIQWSWKKRNLPPKLSTERLRRCKSDMYKCWMLSNILCQMLRRAFTERPSSFYSGITSHAL